MESLTVGTKTCKECRKTKPLVEFYKKGKGHTERCRECHKVFRKAFIAKTRDKHNAKKREHYHKTRERYLAYYKTDKRRARWFEWKLKRQYGITVEQFEQMMEEQGGCCKVCGRPPSEINGHRHKKRLHVDHDHKTGQVRGLLCNSCNVAAGCLGDDIGVMYALIDHISYPKENE
jgi:hypothetical protein